MSRWTNTQVQQAANEVVLAMDGRISRVDAVLVAKRLLQWFDVKPDRPTTGKCVSCDVPHEVEISWADPMPETPMVHP